MLSLRFAGKNLFQDGRCAKTFYFVGVDGYGYKWRECR